jgi:hypothetical protein
MLNSKKKAKNKSNYSEQNGIPKKNMNFKFMWIISFDRTILSYIFIFGVKMYIVLNHEFPEFVRKFQEMKYTFVSKIRVHLSWIIRPNSWIRIYRLSDYREIIFQVGK